MPNYVIETSGTGIDIVDANFAGDFTFEVSFRVDDGVTPTSTATLLGGSGMSLDFTGGSLQLTANGTSVVSTSGTVSPGEWVNAAVVRDAGTTRLYVEGELVDTSQGTWTDPVTVLDMAAGFEGRIDGVRMWSEARDTAQIIEGATGFADVSGGVPNELERYYRFDDDLDHIVDAAGNAEQGHDLHLPSGALIVEDASAPAAQNQGAVGFIDTQVVDGLFLATDMAFLPDGRMLVTQKDGTIELIEDPTQINSPSSTYLDISAETRSSGEAGLLSIQIDPDFATNGYFYVFYTKEAGTDDFERVSRFTHVENTGGTTSTVDLGSETVLWQQSDVHSRSAHLGGAIAIAHEPIDENDPSPYKLYITTGEEFEPANSQDLSHDDGKIHRINLTDGSIPVDNPYYDAAVAATYTPSVNTSSAISTNAANLALDPEGVMTTVYASGLRNPFRASYDQETGSLFIGDVGGNNTGAYEEINIGSSGANYGWPGEEGYHLDPSDPGSPFHAYNHFTGPGVDQLDGYGGYGAAVTGGIVYRGDDLPEEYIGDYFYADWVRKWIRVIDIDWSGPEPVVVNDAHFLNSAGQVLDIAQGPDGSLYYLTTFQTGNVNTFTGAVHRLTYDSTNSAPAGMGIVLDPSEYASMTVPHEVTFEADVTDPDGDALTYQWSFGDGVDLDGDGRGDTATSTEVNPTWTYTDPGTYVVELLVTDANGATTVFMPQTIVVGSAPSVTVTPPTQGLTFRAGDTVTLTGETFDLEDGDISFDANWSVQFQHNGHFHPVIAAEQNDADGLSLTFDTTGHDFYGNTGSIVSLTSTDMDGLTSTESILLSPEESVLTFDLPESVPGFALTVDGINYSSDTVYDNIINFEHVFTVPESYVSNGLLYEFSHWSDDPQVTTAIRTYIVPETDQTIAPIYVEAQQDGQAIAVTNGGGGIAVSAGLVVGTAGADFTVEGWVYFDADEAISNRDGLFRGADENGQDIDLNFGGGVARLFVRSESGDVTAGETAATAGGWQHVAVTRTTGIVQIYTNGEADGDAGESWLSELTIPHLGRAVSGGRFGSLQGALDEVRVWDVARSATEIAASFDTNVAPTSPGLLALFGFDGDGINATGGVEVDTAGAVFVGGAPLGTGGPVQNQTPIAQDDIFTLAQGFDPVGSHLHILDNDSDADGTLNPQMIEIVSQAGFGTIEIMDTAQELADRGLMPGHFGHAEYTPTDPNFQGTDSFTYRVQDDEGTWSNIATATITVGTPPNLAPDGIGIILDTGEATGNAPYLVTFEADAFDPEGGALSYLWDFGDGTTATAADPAHSYDTTGTYTVTLTATDDQGLETTYDTVDITVSTPPVSGNQAVAVANGGGGIAVSAGLVVGTAGADFTVEGWVYFDADEAISNRDGLFRGADENGQDIDLNFGGGVARLFVRSESGDVTAGETAATAGGWQHVAVTRTTGIVQIYTNGEADGDAGESWLSELTISHLGRAVSGGRFGSLQGALDEVRVWDVARSATEIADMFDLSISSPESGLVNNFVFDNNGEDSAGYLELDVAGLQFTDSFDFV